MKQILIPIIATAIFIVLIGLLVQKAQEDRKTGILFTPSPSSKNEITISGTKIFVKLADSTNKRQDGLSNKKSLADNEGMLFVFEGKDIFPSFWMKDMKIPIDIIWINDDKVSKIEKDIPFPAKDVSDNKLTLYRPDKPIDYVLEVNAGFADKHSIQVGDSVDLSNLGLP